MALSFGAIGTGANGSASCAPTYPSGISADTSELYCYVCCGDAAANTPTMPAGWTQIGTLSGGTGTFGIDTGPRRVTAFRKDTVAGTETGTVTVSLTSGNTMRAHIVRYERASGAIVTDAVGTGADTTHGTAFSVTSSSNLSFAPGELLGILVASCTDSAVPSSQAISASGITFGTRTNHSSTAVTTGSDHRFVLDTVPVSSGSGTVAPTYSYTASANTSGPCLFHLMTESLPERTGSMAASESGSDTFAATGGVLVQGTAAGTETGTDVFAATGTVSDPSVTGTLAATETGADAFAATGSVLVAGSLAVTETGADAFAGAGSVLVAGALAVTEAGADTFAATGAVQVAGVLAAVEEGLDTFAATGGGAGEVTGTLTGIETGLDAAQILGAVVVQGSMAATEAGSDTFSAVATPARTGAAVPRRRKYSKEEEAEFLLGEVLEIVEAKPEAGRKPAILVVPKKQAETRAEKSSAVVAVRVPKKARRGMSTQDAARLIRAIQKQQEDDDIETILLYL